MSEGRLLRMIADPIRAHQRTIMLNTGRMVDVTIELDPDLYEAMLAECAERYMFHNEGDGLGASLRRAMRLDRFRVDHHIEVVRRIR